MSKIVYFNGVITPVEKATIPAFDHAYLYGDGLFEGIRIYNKRIFKLDEHLKRLYNGVRHLDIREPMPMGEMRNAILETVEASGEESGYIRVNVSRGTGIGLNPANIDLTPNLMIAITTLALFKPELYQRGAKSVTLTNRVIAPDALDPRVKAIGRYVSNIQARLEANRQGADEGVMLTAQGYVAEGTGDNLFVIKDEVLITPPAWCGILEGITRNTILDMAVEMGHRTREDVLTIHDVYSADEAFLTGTAAEVMPMVSLDGRPISDGQPGPITKKLMKAFHEAAMEAGVLVSG
ncbi:MAG: branched-chain-amino-acid transaminase [Armatimonadetes bacterium]|nr:branched-chain-amino-acid transaminase [Armatimonadota bacterium]